MSLLREISPNPVNLVAKKMEILKKMQETQKQVANAGSTQREFRQYRRMFLPRENG